LINAVVDLLPKTKTYLAPPEIDTKALVGQHLDQIRLLISDLGEALDQIIDLKVLERRLGGYWTRDGINALQVQRLVNLLFLLQTGLGSSQEASPSTFGAAAGKS